MQMVEIAKAVSANCGAKTPTQPYFLPDRKRSGILVPHHAGAEGSSVALVHINSHDGRDQGHADSVTIMRDGQYIGKWEVANMTKEQIIAKMVGRELSNLFPRWRIIPPTK